MWIFAHSTHLGTWQGALPPKTPDAAQRVNDEPVKILNLLFFYLFLLEMSKYNQKTAIFPFGPKKCFYLIHSALEYFEKLAFKKKKTILNNCISRARLNSESKLTFSGSSFNFLQNRIVFLQALPMWVHGWGLCPLQLVVLLPAAHRAWRVKHFAKFIGKELSQSLFLIKLQA